MNDIVQVLLTVDNNIDTIDACLDSIVNQTHDNINLIVFDNSSSDGTSEAIGRREPEIDARTKGFYTLIRLNEPTVPGDCWTFINDYYSTQPQAAVCKVMKGSEVLTPNILKDKYDHFIKKQ